MLSLPFANEDNITRPESQSSIQSTDSCLNIKVDYSANIRNSHFNSENEKLVQKDAVHIPRSNDEGYLTQSTEVEVDNLDSHTIKIFMDQDTSPLYNDTNYINSLKCSENYHSPLETNDDALLLQEIPSSCFPFAYLKLSADVTANTGSSSFYTSSSKLTAVPEPHGHDNLSPLSKKAFNRMKVIEEIIETEETYISGLRMLSGIYLDNIISKGNNGIPTKQINNYVEILIANHNSFLNDLRTLYSITYRTSIDPLNFSPTFNKKAQSLLSCSSPLMAALVSQLISKKAISVYIYQEYSSVHDLVLKLINFKADDPEFGVTLTRGFQNFLEASQNERDKYDLSLDSLIKKPVQRISKYKLFLDTLLKLTSDEEDAECHQVISDCSIQVDYKIKEINRYGTQEKIRSNVLFESLEFGSATLQFPVEYLGLPLLLGSLFVAWVGKDKQVQSQIAGAFLFKTHLILTALTKHDKFEVFMLIPLSVSCRIDNENDINGGLFCTNGTSNHVFKLMFEHNHSIYETLLIASNESEYNVWRDKIDILINQVNGPYKLDYSSSKFNEECGTSVSTILPSDILSFDINLDKFKASSRSQRNMLNKCYFKSIILVTVETIDVYDNPSYHSLRFTKIGSGPQKIQLRLIERSHIEYVLEDLWSDELLPVSMLNRRRKSVLQSNSTTNTTTTISSHTRVVHSSIRAKKVSLMRRTSVVFGDALKSLFYGDSPAIIN